MPLIKEVKKIKLNLPSIEEGWVEVKEELTIADIEKIAEVDVNNGGKVASQLAVLITDWNLEDEKGKLEITPENVRKLNMKDMLFILKSLKLDDPKSFLE